MVAKNCVLKPSRPFPTVRVIRVRNRRDRFTLNHPKKVEKNGYSLRPSETVSEKAPTCCRMKPSRPFQTIPNRTVMIQSETVKTVSTNTIFVTLIIHIYIYMDAAENATMNDWRSSWMKLAVVSQLGTLARDALATNFWGLGCPANCQGPPSLLSSVPSSLDFSVELSSCFAFGFGFINLHRLPYHLLLSSLPSKLHQTWGVGFRVIALLFMSNPDPAVDRLVQALNRLTLAIEGKKRR